MPEALPLFLACEAARVDRRRTTSLAFWICASTLYLRPRKRFRRVEYIYSDSDPESTHSVYHPEVLDRDHGCWFTDSEDSDTLVDPRRRTRVPLERYLYPTSDVYDYEDAFEDRTMPGVLPGWYQHATLTPIPVPDRRSGICVKVVRAPSSAHLL